MNKRTAGIVALCCLAGWGRAGDLSAFESFAGARKVSGVVFNDANGNGIRDEGEAGLPGVRLLANRQVRVTGDDGTYAMVSDAPFLTLAVSFPTGFWPTANRWFHRASADVEERIDFALQPETQNLPFVFAHFTDPHAGLAEAALSIPAEAAAWPVKPRFYLCGGDLRSTTVSVTAPEGIRRDFGAMRDAFAAVSEPVFAIPGNHDVVDLKTGERLPPEVSDHPLFGQRAWEKWVGPAAWSFSCGGVLFIGQEWAEYTAKGWESGTPAIRAWAAGERSTQPTGTRTVILCHAGPVLDADLALSGHTHALGPSYGSERRLMGGQSGRHYTGELWNSETARRGEEPFVERVPIRTKPALLRRFGEDGCPSGYRLVAVYPDRLDTFYKVIDEPRTIMVNAPRRNRPVAITNGVLIVRGQAFDPEGKLGTVTVTCGGDPVAADLRRSLLWVDFTASFDAREWTDGCRTLTVRATGPDGTFCLSENYVVRTGRADAFRADAEALLKGWTERGSAATEVFVNGEAVGTAQPGMGAFAFPVRAGLLQRLNTVTLQDRGADTLILKNVHLSDGGNIVVDQRLTAGFGLGRSLRRDQPLYLDVKVPGKVTPWRVVAE